MTGPHPRKIEDGWVKNAVDAVKKIFKKGVTVVRGVHDKYLLIKDGSASVVDYEDLPDDKKEEHRFQDKREKLSRGGDTLKNSRYDTYTGQSPSKIASRASDNPHILSDILDDPGLVDASGESEAVAKVAEQNPSWAKISDAVESHGLEVDGDGNVSEAGSSGDGGSGTGDTGGVETADPGDLGPSTPGDYGMDVGGDSGDAGGTGDGGGDVGGDVGGDGSGSGGGGGSGDGGGLGGDVGGGDL